MEIACDESGYEGEQLIGSATEVFAHASVRIDADVAAFCVAELRDRIGSPAQEYKATHLLRSRSRPTLIWFLDQFGPLRDNAHVVLVDKAYFAVRAAIDVLIADRTAAARLYDSGRAVFGDELWDFFLDTANDFVRARENPTAIETFFEILDIMRYTPGADELVESMWRARARAEAYRAALLERPPVFPALDALFPAVLRAVAYWGSDEHSVAISHDRQNSFSARRIDELTRQAAGRLERFRLVDSYADPRVQVADFLAGIARKLATGELNGEGDPELTGLLRRYVDAESIWADERSWSRLAPVEASAPPERLSA